MMPMMMTRVMVVRVQVPIRLLVLVQVQVQVQVQRAVWWNHVQVLKTAETTCLLLSVF